MPFKPRHPCNYSGCPEITATRFCPKHEALDRKKYEEKRKTSVERGYNSQWQKLRAMKLAQDPLCEEHLRQNVDVAATMVHHIKPVETNPELRLVMENLMSLCNPCHEEKEKEGRWGK